MDDPVVAFIGGGNMARSLVGGLIANGRAPARIRVAEPVDALRTALPADLGVAVHATEPAAAYAAAEGVQAVKPQVMAAVCESLAPLARAQRPLVVSIAAGIPTGRIEAWLGGDAAVVRTMPNTPALLGAGATGLFATAKVDAGRRADAEALMRAAGVTAWIDDEALMDAVTAVSGSGPAYVFLLAEALQAAGEAEGLPAETARLLATQTLLGASRMLAESGESAATLRQRVTSPNGTTQAALEAFEAGGFRALVRDAVGAAARRGRELAEAGPATPPRNPAA